MESGLTSISETNNAFGLELFQKLTAAERTENVLISPLSIAMALTMAACGATNEQNRDVSKEMRKVLQQQSLEEEQVKEQFAKYLQTSEDVQVLIANSAWIKQGEAINTEFQEIIRKSFAAESKALSTATAINDWCAEHTKGLITHLLDVIPENVVLMLLNAVYFKGTWKTQFDPTLTQKDEFRDSNGSTSSVDMMQLHDKEFQYYQEQDNFQLVHLDYGKSDQYHATIILPHSSKSVAHLIDNLSNENWNIWRKAASTQEGTLFLPRIKVGYGVRSLKNELEDMGMRSAFADCDAFQRIGQNIFLSDVLHKTVVELDEQGTKAAAVTAALFSRCIRRTFEMKVNRPFLFLISEKESGAILFVGRIEHPQ